ncbi:MAG: gliding motility-associated C-terminal domain-containing protein [Bacteroidota bacterium]
MRKTKVHSLSILLVLFFISLFPLPVWGYSFFYSPNDLTHSITEGSSDLRISIVTNNLIANTGDTITFILTVNNTGPDNATGTTVTAIIPDGYSYVSHTEEENYDPSNGIWSIGELENNSFSFIEIKVEVNPQGNYSFNASVTSEQTDPVPEDNTDSFRIQLSDLRINKSVSDELPDPGSNIFFTIEISNNGPDEATNVVVEDLLSDGYTFISASPSAQYNPQTGHWIPGNLPAETTKSLQIEVTVKPEGNYLNSASVVADQHDPFPADNEDSVLVEPQFFILAEMEKKVNDEFPLANDTITFTIQVSNTGTTSSEESLLTDRLPDGFVYVSSSTSNDNDYDPQTGEWNVGELIPDEANELIINAIALKTGDHKNTAILTGDFLTEPLISSVEVFPKFHPVANPDSVSVNWKGSAEIDVLANDEHPQLDPSTLEIIETLPSGASSVVTDNNTIFISYENTPAFTGSEFLIYQISTTEGLSDTSKVLIDVNIEKPRVPNTFSPNDDNINDYLVIPGLEQYPGNQLTIFNRLGAEVFNMIDYDNSWDGKNKDTGSELPVGTYYYILKLNNNLPAEKGYIYLTR